MFKVYLPFKIFSQAENAIDDLMQTSTAKRSIVVFKGSQVAIPLVYNLDFTGIVTTRN